MRAQSDKRQRILVVLLIVALATASYIYWATRIPQRPPNIPEDSTYVPLDKTYKWVHCWLDQQRRVNRCSVYQSDGTLYFEDDYLPYGSSRPIPPERLKISDRSLADYWIILLQDGTQLMRHDFLDRTEQMLNERRGRVQ